MRLDWQKDPKSLNRYVAESVRYRFIMIATTRGKAHLWVQRAGDPWGTKPIDERECRSGRHAEVLAQRFENAKQSRRLR
jgi:hypothetical protein